MFSKNPRIYLENERFFACKYMIYITKKNTSFSKSLYT